MNTGKLNLLPEWDAFNFPLVDEGDEWKWKVRLDAARSLYEQWREVFQLVYAFADTLPEPSVQEEGQMMPDVRSLLFENAFIVAPKIRSASGDTLYAIKMENAALIRFNCNQMMEQISFAVLMGKGDPAHKAVIEEAMEEFRVRFRYWVSLFEKDGLEDEWGLFG
jgi:hypothetical protein